MSLGVKFQQKNLKDGWYQWEMMMMLMMMMMMMIKYDGHEHDERDDAAVTVIV